MSLRQRTKIISVLLLLTSISSAHALEYLQHSLLAVFDGDYQLLESKLEKKEFLGLDSSELQGLRLAIYAERVNVEIIRSIEDKDDLYGPRPVISAVQHANIDGLRSMADDLTFDFIYRNMKPLTYAVLTARRNTEVDIKPVIDAA